VKRSGVLALDLGTTAFKAAPVSTDGLLGPVHTAPYTVETSPGGAVHCPPERYWETAQAALRGAAQSARDNHIEIVAIGISSQAQTFAPCDASGSPLEPFSVWTDARPVEAAALAAEHFPDFATRSGFSRPDPMQLLPKLIDRHRQGAPSPPRFLQLPEWILLQLTGDALGDTMIQGMGGLFDISAGQWNPKALELAGVGSAQLPELAAPGSAGRPLLPEIAGELGLTPGIPVIPCGNDQSCAAVGAGASTAGDIFANFGTALVALALGDRFAAPIGPNQIAGIGPLPGTWFLLGLEPECGNLIEQLARLLNPDGGVAAFLDNALHATSSDNPPRFQPTGGGRLDILGLTTDCTRDQFARASVDFFADRFLDLVRSLAGTSPLPTTCRAGGGLSRSQAWCQLVEARTGIRLLPTAGEHPGLVGIARIVAANSATNGARLPTEQPPLSTETLAERSETASPSTAQPYAGSPAPPPSTKSQLPA